MNEIEKLRLLVNSLAEYVDQEKKFFGVVLPFVVRLKYLVSAPRSEVTQGEFKLLAQKIDEFYARYRPRGGDFYSPPHETSATDSTVKEINAIVATLAKLDEPSFKSLFPEMPIAESSPQTDPVVILERIFSRFHQVAKQLRVRHESRHTLDVNDEYDVQDLLHALLRLHFEDIRTEEWTPSYAGGSSRMDFLMKTQQIVVEVKKTRSNLRDKQVGEQLIVDIEKYKQHPNCRRLFCFVYDPEGLIGNPVGLENDLARQSRNNLEVRVFIFPR
jgi:hypothetical protein